MNSKQVQDPLAKAEPEHVETPVSGSRERGNSAKEETLLEKVSKDPLNLCIARVAVL